MRLHFNGPTPYTVNLPVPFVARSEFRGTVTFDPDGEIPKEDGENLLAVDPRFERLDARVPRTPPPVPAKRKPPRRDPRRAARLALKRAPSPTRSEGAPADGHLATGEGQQE